MTPPPPEVQSSFPLLALAAIALALYMLGSLGYPWRRCKRCNDAKKFFGPGMDNAFRMCPRCQGKGRELRWGMRIWRGLFGRGWGRND